jgi:hypothetical protein
MEPIDEEQRQLVLLALAILSLQRPGWDQVLRETARKFHGEEMYDSFVAANRED